MAADDNFGFNPLDFSVSSLEWKSGIRSVNTPEPAPKPSAHPAVWPLVIRDMADRDTFGREKYGVPLQPHNGRDALKDAYQEALDLAVYLRTAIYERDGQ